jgi:hypothetical protein
LLRHGTAHVLLCPGCAPRAAEQLLAYADANVIPVLVVPFMSRAGAETADRVRLNWVDLSGNAHIRAQDYRFSGHDILTGHMSGTGIDLARILAGRLESLGIHHAFTGLPAAWALDQFARFRLTTVYVHGDPREAAELPGLRRTTKGANVQLAGPNDEGVFSGEQDVDGLHSVAPVQIYLDLLQLPERAAEAAEHLRAHHLRWRHGATG